MISASLAREARLNRQYLSAVDFWLGLSTRQGVLRLDSSARGEEGGGVNNLIKLKNKNFKIYGLQPGVDLLRISFFSTISLETPGYCLH